MSPISLKFYIDANDISSTQGKLSVTANGGSIPVGSETSDAAATLINAINAIPTDQTIQTTIEMRIRFGSGWSDCGPFDSTAGGSMSNEGSISIIIDWVNNQVTWNGLTQGGLDRYNGSDTVPGNLLIERLNGSGPVDEQESFMLGTTEERKISRLPIPGFGHLSYAVPENFAWYWSLGSWDGQINVDYVITTDKGATVIVAPTPPAAPVVGVKISELPPAPSLQDDDLFVLSQDQPDDEIYDINYRVTLARLKAALSTSFQSGKWVADNTLSISTTNVTSCRISIATGLFDSTDTGSIMGQFDVSSKSLSLTQVYNGGAGSAPSTPEGKTKTLTDLFQDMDIQPGSNGVIVTAKFDADALSIKLAGTNMRGTYLISLS
tara:strand:+ start:645 stop:1781 length:1137 start_codon:yes stop_codon:yes gene_type:complete